MFKVGWIMNGKGFEQRGGGYLSSVAMVGFVTGFSPFGFQWKIKELFHCTENGIYKVWSNLVEVC